MFSLRNKVVVRSEYGAISGPGYWFAEIESNKEFNV